ncbi:hypothetical protein KUCAC02_036803 [Chaenocephalus aceratus]|nr:hypothetical protein KUCAC02_036803 [Chaenocephalus aceratus]
MSVSPAVTTLCENSDEVFLDAAKLLLTYCDNIMRFPDEEKYRSIRIGNPTFSTKLLPVRGAVERPLRDGVRIRGSDEAHQGLHSSGKRPETGGEARCISHYSPLLPLPLPPSSLENSMNFFATLQSNFQHVLLYENLDLQQKALSRIPEERLRSEAEAQLRGAGEEDPDCKLGLEDFLVLELLRWFKQDFFSWVDHLPCSRCSGATQTLTLCSPPLRTCAGGPRGYNNPEKLLETRRGRCGEWANCFTLCCRAMGLEARYIWDSTDHVWTEVFSTSQRRWLHCDSCENGCDNLLLYEVGWGKKLAYILAFSKDQVRLSPVQCHYFSWCHYYTRDNDLLKAGLRCPAY